MSGMASRRLSGRLLAMLALLRLLVSTDPALASAPRAVSVVAARTTTVEWTGTAGLRLVIPEAVVIPESAMHLYVTGGTYAFVRMRMPEHLACGDCNKWGLTFLRDFTRAGLYEPGLAKRGLDHETNLSDPPRVSRGTMELYLFTDGTARLTFDIAALRGSIRVRAAGRVRGIVRRISDTCLGAGCDVPFAGNGVRVGGYTYDVGSLGHAEGIAVAYPAGAPTMTGTPSRIYSTARICHYPNSDAPDASADPAAHPTGCDAAPSGAGDTTTLKDDANAVGPWTGAQNWRNNVTGRAYVGMTTAFVGPTTGVQRAWGLWFTNGIR